MNTEVHPHRQHMKEPLHLKNLDRLRHLIVTDCMIKGMYVSCEGQTCAVGKLALDCDVTREELEKVNRMCITADDANTGNLGTQAMSVLNKMRRNIEKKFGLTLGQLDDIQYRNDCWETPEERRKAILEFLGL